MDITPSPAFCAACRIVLSGDTPDIVIPALRTALKRDIDRYTRTLPLVGASWSFRWTRLRGRSRRCRTCFSPSNRLPRGQDDADDQDRD
jgi:hypothetical protein